MNVALRRHMQRLYESVPPSSSETRDQMWRNVVTGLNRHPHQGRSVADRRGRLGLFAVGMVALLLTAAASPAVHERVMDVALMRLYSPPLLEAAGRDHGGVPGLRERASREPDGFVLVNHTPDLELFLYDKGTQLLIRDKSTGQMWRTSPDVRDARVPVEWLGRVSSPFVIRYKDDSGRIDGWVNPVDDATAITHHPLSKGIGMRFHFEPLGISVRIDFELGADYLQMSIPPGGVEEYGTYRVHAIEMLPYLAPVGEEPEEQLLFPTRNAAYDALEHMRWTQSGVPQRAEPAFLFGRVGLDAGFVGIVTEGAADARLHLGPSGYLLGFDGVHVEFDLARSRSDRRPASSASTAHTVRYYLVTGDEAAQEGASSVLHRYLNERYGVGLRAFQPSSANPSQS